MLPVDILPISFEYFYLVGYLIVALSSFWAVIARPDKWGGANDYTVTMMEIIGAIFSGTYASTKSLARFKFLNMICLATSAFCVFLLYSLNVSNLVPTSQYFDYVLILCQAWFFLTVIAASISVVVGSPISGNKK